MRVVAAMSGGVDSSVAAARMLRAGHDVVGVHLALGGDASLPPGSGGCCSLQDSADARRVADLLGIPFYVWDMTAEFREGVIDDFVAQYAAGRTPNPCLRCNERIKFSALLDKARAFGFDAVATGHYARIVEAERSQSGERELHRATDPAKDQSYVLGVLTGDQLAGAEFPLGASTKPEIRREARELGLAVADKPDSHDLCFVPSGDTRVWLGARLGTRTGAIVEEDGTVVGTHHGAFAFTVGQRKGLDIPRPASDGRPRYVLRTDVPTNTVVVGPAEALDIAVVVGEEARWCGSPPAAETEVGVQMRAHGEELPATAVSDGCRVHVRLRSAARGVAAGQTLVLYSGTRVVGSATITETRAAGHA